MPNARAPLSKEEQLKLWTHLQKHALRTSRYRFRKLINATNFNHADGALGSYFTFSFTPSEHIGIVSVACGFIITPNTSVGTLAVILSYNPTITLADNSVATKPDDQGNELYMLTSNGGAINDFQVFFPLDYFLEPNKKIYAHVWADATLVAAATTTMSGHLILGSLSTGVS